MLFVVEVKTIEKWERRASSVIRKKVCSSRIYDQLDDRRSTQDCVDGMLLGKMRKNAKNVGDTREMGGRDGTRNASLKSVG